MVLTYGFMCGKITPLQMHLSKLTPKHMQCEYTVLSRDGSRANQCDSSSLCLRELGDVVAH